MGWYHAMQLLNGRIPGARLTSIVSPTGLEKGSTLLEWAEGQPQIQEGSLKLYSSVAEMVAEDPPTHTSVVIIACRTSDMPQRLRDTIDHGFRFVYLEKPGASSPDELEKLAKHSQENGAKVYMGYNKNVAGFVQAARDEHSKVPGSAICFEHNNAYKPDELDSCFESNSEGMLKNMAIHELMLAVTFFGFSVSALKTVELDKGFSKCEKRGRFADFSRIKFTMTNVDGKSMTIKADRCGGNTSKAVVTKDGEELVSKVMPDKEDEKRVAKLDAAMPGVTSYLHAQDEQYLAFKVALCRHALGGPPPEGMATIQQGVEVLHLAEHLTPILMSQCN